MGISESQIYNVDETGLYYRCLPDKTYVSALEKSAPGHKTQKERISVLLGANSDGSCKLLPLVIGKAKNPRCFKKFNNPLHYDFSKNAWMTSRIFYDWFHKIFINEVSAKIIYKLHNFKTYIFFNRSFVFPRRIICLQKPFY